MMRTLAALALLTLVGCDATVPDDQSGASSTHVSVPTGLYAGPGVGYSHILEFRLYESAAPDVWVSGEPVTVTHYSRNTAPWDPDDPQGLPGTCPSYCPSQYEYASFRYMADGEAVQIIVAPRLQTNAVWVTARSFGQSLQMLFYEQEQP